MIGRLAAVLPLAAYLAPAVAKPLGERRLRQRCHGTLALTYDDGPGPRLTPRVLDLLRERSARATFFAVGERALAAPELLDRAVAAGHEVNCHTHAHLHAWRASPRAAMRDVERGYVALAPWLDTGAFRPPHGKLSLATWLAVSRHRAPLAWWTTDSGDTHAATPAPGAVVSAVAAADGGVVLLHDFDRDPPDPAREAFVLDVTAGLLDAAERHGWRVCTFGAI